MVLNSVVFCQTWFGSRLGSVSFRFDFDGKKFKAHLVLNIYTLVYKNDFFSDENFYHTHTMAWVLVVGSSFDVME